MRTSHQLAQLIIRGIPRQLWSAGFKPERQALGRSTACEVVLTHTSVSRRHAQIWQDDQAYWIKDLGSRNGTFVDGVKITESQLSVGNELRIGHVTLDVVAERDSQEDPEVETAGSSLNQVDDRAARLTPSELEVFSQLLLGRSEKQIASELCLSPHTIHTHVKRIYKRLEVNSRAELMAQFLPSR